ncbi:MAG: anaerobic ribonucleoside-triphosphate reductase activating protein [Clostridia bacterium]|nr:anaerobic ribonucleoside-triphosphate reductase activating protein [Clostridia bacterium]
MRIAGLEKCSTVDFPGGLAAVLFAPGCNYRCFYCHNRQILGNPPLLDEAEVFRFLKKRAGLLDAVVFSGGEPALQSGLADCIREVRALGYKVKLDTNGSRPEVLRSLLSENLLDYAAMDYKAPFGDYPSITGQDASGVAESLSLLLAGRIPFELRTTVVPMLTETKLKEMAAAVPHNVKWFLQLYRPQQGDEAFLGSLHPYSQGKIETLAEKLQEVRPLVRAR